MTFAGLLLVLSLSLDQFAAAVALGIGGLPRHRWTRTAGVFAAFSTFMPVLGLLAGRALTAALGTVATYVAGAVLLVIGLRGVADRIWRGDAREGTLEQASVLLTAFILALDNLAVGLSLAVVQAPVGPLLAAIAVVGFVVTMLGLAAGSRVGQRVGGVAELVGAGVFVLLGAVLLYQAMSGSHLA